MNQTPRMRHVKEGSVNELPLFQQLSHAASHATRWGVREAFTVLPDGVAPALEPDPWHPRSRDSVEEIRKRVFYKT